MVDLTIEELVAVSYGIDALRAQAEQALCSGMRTTAELYEVQARVLIGLRGPAATGEDDDAYFGPTPV